MMEYEPFIKSHLSACNQVQDFMCCEFGHVTSKNLNSRNLRTPPGGQPCFEMKLAYPYGYATLTLTPTQTTTGNFSKVDD